MNIEPVQNYTGSYNKDIVVERMSRSNNQTSVWVLKILSPVYARSCLWNYLNYQNL